MSFSCPTAFSAFQTRHSKSSQGSLQVGDSSASVRLRPSRGLIMLSLGTLHVICVLHLNSKTTLSQMLLWA